MPYIVRVSSAQMPSQCKGVYKKVAVVEVEMGVQQISMISTRAKGVVRIVSERDKLHVGKTERCAFAIALREAEELARRLNEEEQALFARTMAAAEENNAPPFTP